MAVGVTRLGRGAKNAKVSWRGRLAPVVLDVVCYGQTLFRRFGDKLTSAVVVRCVQTLFGHSKLVTLAWPETNQGTLIQPVTNIHPRKDTARERSYTEPGDSKKKNQNHPDCIPVKPFNPTKARANCPSHPKSHQENPLPENRYAQNIHPIQAFSPHPQGTEIIIPSHQKRQPAVPSNTNLSKPVPSPKNEGEGQKKKKKITTQTHQAHTPPPPPQQTNASPPHTPAHSPRSQQAHPPSSARPHSD